MQYTDTMVRKIVNTRGVAQEHYKRNEIKCQRILRSKIYQYFRFSYFQDKKVNKTTKTQNNQINK